MTRAGDSYQEARYERKFLVSELTKYEVELLVKLHPAVFRERHEERFVNNIYFDSPDLPGYWDSVDGVKDRIKIRIRWYGNAFGVINEPTLELKIKDGLLTTKRRFSLVPFSRDESFQIQTIRDAVQSSKIPGVVRLQVTSLEASLLNRYRRKYFESASGRCRLTIDTEMEFYPTQEGSSSARGRSVDPVHTIVELKYDREADGSERWVSSCFPFRLCRNSKYVNGVDRLHL